MIDLNTNPAGRNGPPSTFRKDLPMTTIINDHVIDADELPGKTITRADETFGHIAARVQETRFADGQRRFSVVFRRNISDHALEGSFSMSLGQDELMSLIAAASAAYHEIDSLRSQRRFSGVVDVAYDQLSEKDGWEEDDEEFFASQLES